MKNTLLAILLTVATAGWAVTYTPYVNPRKTAAPRSTAVHYDMPDFQFYSTSIYQSAHGYGTSRIAQHGEVRVLSTQERLGPEYQRQHVEKNFNILGEEHKPKQRITPLMIADPLTMRSTSTMLSNGGQRRVDPTLANIRTVTMPRRAGIAPPDEEDDDDVENGTPVGDAVLPMIIMALLFCGVQMLRRRKEQAEA